MFNAFTPNAFMFKALIRKFSGYGRWQLGVSVVCGVLGLSLLFNGSYMMLKAELAQQMLALSWQRSLTTGQPHKPWVWADTDVAARIRFLRLNEERYVMRDASGESLSFGPGLVSMGLASINGGVMPVNSVAANMNAAVQDQTLPGTAIAGHRDSHFGLLRELKPDDIIELERRDHTTVRFRVTSSDIIDTRYQQLATPMRNELALITCYPFASLVPNGPLRYVVFGEVVNDNNRPRDASQSFAQVDQSAL